MGGKKRKQQAKKAKGQRQGQQGTRGTAEEQRRREQQQQRSNSAKEERASEHVRLQRSDAVVAAAKAAQSDLDAYALERGEAAMATLLAGSVADDVAERVAASRRHALACHSSGNYVGAMLHLTTAIQIVKGSPPLAASPVASMLYCARAVVQFLLEEYDALLKDLEEAKALPASAVDWLLWMCSSFAKAVLGRPAAPDLDMALALVDHMEEVLQVSLLPELGFHKAVAKLKEAVSIASPSKKVMRRNKELFASTLRDLGSRGFGVVVTRVKKSSAEDKTTETTEVVSFEQSAVSAYLSQLQTSSAKGRGDGPTLADELTDYMDFNDLPPLVPLGESLGKGGEDLYVLCASECLNAFSPQELAVTAMEAKEQGNDAFKREDYKSALLNYSRAIRLNPSNAVFYSNRACVYLKLERYQETISDCTASIERLPSIKAYARRASARAALKEYWKACADYRCALDFEPTNQTCLQELAKCLCHIKEQVSRELVEGNPENADVINRKLNLIRANIKDIEVLISQCSRDKKSPKQKGSTPVAAQEKAPPSPRKASAAIPALPTREGVRSTPGKEEKSRREGEKLQPQRQPRDQKQRKGPQSDAEQAAGVSSTGATTWRELPPATLEEIIENCTLILEKDSSDSWAYCERGKAYQLRGDLGKALSDFRDGLRVDPDNRRLLQAYKALNLSRTQSKM